MPLIYVPLLDYFFDVFNNETNYYYYYFFKLVVIKGFCETPTAYITVCQGVPSTLNADIFSLVPFVPTSWFSWLNQYHQCSTHGLLSNLSAHSRFPQ